MTNLTLTIQNISSLNEILEILNSAKRLGKGHKNLLRDLLSQIPKANFIVAEGISLQEGFYVNILDTDSLWARLEQWKTLFCQLPGWDYCPLCNFVESDDYVMLNKHVLMVAYFAPSFSYNKKRGLDPFEVHLKDDGTAVFSLPTLRDSELYSTLYNFRGTWKEAYLVLIETLKKGWSIEQFPEELRKFLPTT